MNFVSSISGLLPLVMASLASGEPNDGEMTAAVWWIVGAAGVAVIFNNLFSAWTNLTGRFKEKEHPGPMYQSVEVCERMHKAITDAIEEVEQRQTKQIQDTEERHSLRTEQLRKEIKADVGGIHKRVDEVLKGVSRLEGKIEA